jgi:hypothetical protein
MSLFKPSKAKCISTVLIFVAMWTAHKLEDLIGDPLLARLAPSTSAVIESSGANVEHVEKTDESDVVLAGVILYGVEIVVKVGVSYLFACIIVHFFFDRRLKASNKAGPRGLDEA